VDEIRQAFALLGVEYRVDFAEAAHQYIAQSLSAVHATTGAASGFDRIECFAG